MRLIPIYKVKMKIDTAHLRGECALKCPPRLPGAINPCNNERDSDTVLVHDIV
jgi:hypothetical protein